jgi:hypothetical protein
MKLGAKPGNPIGNPRMKKGAPSMNPRGKAAGNRDKICRELLSDMADAWAKYGVKALKELALSDPGCFVKAYVALLPREVKVDAMETMTEDQILARIRELSVTLGIEGVLLPAGEPGSRKTTH